MFSDICVVFPSVCLVIFNRVLCFSYLFCVLYIELCFAFVLCFAYLYCVLHICVVFCMFVLCFVLVGHRTGL